ncbi:hypothetical protein [Flavobacterium terrae]|uniref:YhhN-like protein n=1 Tax=Flavobacterium terrae TaxID=415425 RepID=A0A1M6FKH2_9FLAO|nr:hypothetical protein [Flavobacterium terrae]SHI98163.1 hypothetical protein SAMN05444363_2212 [Flavobacterium terrae]
MILEIIGDLGYVLLFLNTIILSVGFPKNGKAYKIFTIYTVIMFLIQMSSFVLLKLQKNNLYMSHFYFILQFIFLSFFYLQLNFKNDQKKIIKAGFVFCFFTLGVQYALDCSLFWKFNLFEIFITSFLLIVYAVFHLYNLLNEKKEFYYINVGILLYLFGSTILFLSGNLMVYLSPELNTVTWILNAFLYVIYQLFILFELKKGLPKDNLILRNE